MDEYEPFPKCPECGEELSPTVPTDGPDRVGLDDRGGLVVDIPAGWQCENSKCRTNQPGSLGGDNGGG